MFNICAEGQYVAGAVCSTGISVAFAFKTGMFNIGAEGQYVAGAVCAVLVGSTLDLPMVISVAFAFKTGMFNIGAEGQYVAGAVCAVLVGSTLDLPMVLQVPVVILAGIAGGAAIGAITGFLKARFGIHEVITAIMLNWTMLYLNNFVVNSEMFHRPSSTSSIPVNPSSYTMILPEWKLTDPGLETLRNVPWLYDFLVKAVVIIAFIVAILVAIAIWFVLDRSKLGFELRAVGFNRDAAEFAGMPVERNTVLAMVLAGGISGLAGALMITGIQPHCISTLAAFENYGFNGFSVALIAGRRAYRRLLPHRVHLRGPAVRRPALRRHLRADGRGRPHRHADGRGRPHRHHQHHDRHDSVLRRARPRGHPLRRAH